MAAAMSNGVNRTILDHLVELAEARSHFQFNLVNHQANLRMCVQAHTRPTVKALY